MWISEAITKKPVHDYKCRASSFSNEKTPQNICFEAFSCTFSCT
uniref:Uncharacterized protein n=1 Tax=Siphoviridae sp. cttm829 TaxID=2825707 RepID=A0A8S5PGQ0_9CAUD|nr:MAG TPA: hypothetical protein [Siphoviridae sp. cttm829]